MAKKPVKKPSKPAAKKAAEKPVELMISDGVISKVDSPEEPASVAAAPAAVEPKKVNLNREPIAGAISQGLELIHSGKSKADAARAIYGVLKDEQKEVIVAAFVAGATLTEKGALTYWYNCKRKAKKEANTAG